jgi:hypothetical protein
MASSSGLQIAGPAAQAAPCAICARPFDQWLARRKANLDECFACPNIRTKSKWAAMAMTHSELKLKISADRNLRAEFVADVEMWEEQKRSGNTVSNRKRAQSSVSAVMTSSLEVSRHLGHLWPIDVYKRERDGEVPDKKTMTSINFNGEIVRGWVMPYDVLGSYKMSSKHETFVKKDGELSNSDENAKEEMDKSLALAQAMIRPKSVTQEDGEELIVFKTEPTDETKVDVDMLDDTWGTKKKTEDAEDELDGQPTEAKSRRRNNNNASENGSKQKYADVRKLNKADTVMLEVDQTLHSVSNDSLLTLAMNAMTTLKDKVDGRLTAELTQAYWANYVPGNDKTRGSRS